MKITVNEELKAYIDPLTPDEYQSLERSLLAEGCRDALVLWGDVLVDGHNRYGICQKHGLPFQTVQNTHFQSMDDVHLWMIDQHLGRRSVSDFQRGVLALRKRDILSTRQASTSEEGQANVTEKPVLKSRSEIAKAARLSSTQVQQIEKIQKQAAPELVAAVKSGDISIHAAAAVATLPVQEQAMAALGGKAELQQAAKRVRENSRPKAHDNTKAAGDDKPVMAETDFRLQSMQQEIDRLRAENEQLRQHLALLQAQTPS